MSTGRKREPMDTESREHLSSLMDGEVSQETGRFLVRRLGANGELRQTWARYHLIRDCMRHQDGQLAKLDLTGRIQAALASEPAEAASSQVKRSWFKPVAGAAIAASVALVAVMTVSQQGPSALPVGPETAQPAVAESFTSPNIGSVTRAAQPVNLSGSTGQNNPRMTTYLLRHYQASGEAGGKGFVSFVPIVVAPANVSASADVQADAEQDQSGKDGESERK